MNYHNNTNYDYNNGYNYNNGYYNSKQYKKQQRQRKLEEFEKNKKASEERKDSLGPGLSAFTNLGNTCYMNSALQCLAHTPMFSAYFTTKSFMESITENQLEELAKEYHDDKDPNKTIIIQRCVLNNKIQETLSYQFYRILNRFWRKNCVVVPRSFKKTIEKLNDEFIGYNQNDSHEVINLILDKVNEETSIEATAYFRDISQQVSDLNVLRQNCYNIIDDVTKTPEEQNEAKILYKSTIQKNLQNSTILSSFAYWKNHLTRKSIISDLFTGLFCSFTKCCECNNVTTKFEPFTNLSVSIPDNKNSTLEECLESFSKQEILDGENKKQCEECKKKTKSVKRMIIWELPDILIIQLIRFVATNTGIYKNSSFVKFPLTNLSLNKCQMEWHSSSSKYGLHAVSNHMGSIKAGHYLAHCKNPVMQKWYEYNDEDIYVLDESILEKEIVTSNAYTLFYNKQCDSDDESDSE